MKPGQINLDDYDTQLTKKVDDTVNEFQKFSPPTLQIFPSPKKNFRFRAEFKIWHEGDSSHYAMYEPGAYKKPVVITDFEIGSTTITAMMPKLLEAINRHHNLRKKLFQVEFLTTTTDECVITLIYHRKLDDLWIDEAQKLEQQLACNIIGRSRGQKVVLSKDFVNEKMTVGNDNFHYHQIETGFTQPNAFICQTMLNWASTAVDSLGGDLLELYCGNGNFTLPLSKKFEKVLATEVSKTSVNSAQINLEKNKIENITVVRMSSEEFGTAMRKDRSFRRLKETPLEDYDFSTIFVDPPRAGLDPKTVALCQEFDNILYISCNPDTLAQNLATLNQTHTLEQMALFDQFPYTPHRELGVLLSKRASKPESS